MKQAATILIVFYFLYMALGNTKSRVATVENNNINAYTMISEGQSLLKEGDLIVRLNRDPLSQLIKDFNRHDKSYSHAGIVLYENGYPYVYHIINGDENPCEKLKRDSLYQFCNPRKNIAYGIFRYDLSAEEIKKLKDCVHQWYIQGVSFDSAFDLKSDDKMYCSEMVSKALAKATNKRIWIKPTKLTNTEAKLFSTYTHLPVTYTHNLQIISIDELYSNQFCHLIKEYNYEKNNPMPVQSDK